MDPSNSVARDKEDESLTDIVLEEHKDQTPPRWKPSGVSWSWRDFLHFAGPGWFVSIAYVDPGNYQADIQVGALSGYRLLWTVLWTSVLSIYVQVLCVRLAVYAQVTLAEVQSQQLSRYPRYLAWFIAELSAVLTDLPEVIGIGIACNVFFGVDYWVGVVLSLITTMLFLATLQYGLSTVESIVFLFVVCMSIALFIESWFVGVNSGDLMKGLTIDAVHTKSSDLFAVTGILGAVVMPHNLYLHTATCQSRRVERTEEAVKQAVRYASWEPVVPILFSVFLNMSIVSIAAETVRGTANADFVGLTDFCNYFKTLQGGCFLWGVALTAAGQSSAITTTFTGQYVMDGFLEIRLPVWQRAVLTRLVAILPCVIVSVAVPHRLNQVVNIVNSSLSVLLPFALTPLIKYNASTEYMGEYAAGRNERRFLYALAALVYLINALSLVLPGAGFFDFVYDHPRGSGKQIVWVLILVAVEIFYAWWIWNCLTCPVDAPMRPLNEERPYILGEFADASVSTRTRKGEEALQEMVSISKQGAELL